MATSKLEKVKEDFLTCIICTEPYTDPCTLACDHTFCRKCITQYLQTRPECKVSKTIPCAECRQDTNVPDPTKPIEEWCKQIKPSIIIVGLIDTLEVDDGKTVTTVKEQRSCTLCGKIGETTPATSWCQHCEDALCDRCTKMHRVNTASRDHELHDLSGEIMVRRKRRVICQEHKDEAVKFHCRNCKKSACQTCCIIHHRACKSVVTIESMKSEIMNILSEKRNLVYKKLEIKSARLPKLKVKVEEVNQQEDQVLSQIRSATEEAITKLKLKEIKLIEELKAVTQKDILQLQADLKTEEIDIQSYKQHYEFINHVLQSQFEMDLYHAYMACETGAGEAGDGWSQNSGHRRQVDRITLLQDKAKVHQTLDDLRIGEIAVTYQNDRSLVPSPVLYDTIDAKMDSDKTDLRLGNIIVMVADGIQRIVVGDYVKKCLKTFYRKCSKIHESILLMDYGPSGITQVNEKEVMVTLPNSSHIIIVQVIPALVLLSTTKTQNGYCSLCFLSASSSLLAGSYDPPCIDVLSMDCHVLRSISQLNTGEMFPISSFLCLTPSGILISDCDSDECMVTCITLEGNVLWKYSPAEDDDFWPTGITTTQKGDVLIADRELGRVIQLTESGEFIRDVVAPDDGLMEPVGIYLDKNGVLFVCNTTDIKQYICA